MNKMHLKVSMERKCQNTKHSRQKKCGTFLEKIKFYTAASPDGIVTCKCHGKGLIEIKVSYSTRDKKSLNLLENVTLTSSTTMAGSLSKPQILYPSYFSNVNYKTFYCYFVV